MNPFVIFGLPRSRTAWLARFLAYQGRSVGHDLGVEATSCQNFIDRIWENAGTVETGAMFAHPLIRTALPRAKFVTIRRPRDDVAASLARLGIAGMDDELRARDAHLNAIEAGGALRIDYAELADVRRCAVLFEHLLGVAFDYRWWAEADATNVQIDMPARIARLSERAQEIAALKAEAAAMMLGNPQFVRIAWEPFAHAAEETEALGRAHSAEVNAGERRGHPYDLDTALLLKMEAAGALRFMGARVNGELAGYIIWTFQPDAESKGVMLADQGPLFVRDDPAFRRLHLGRKMLHQALADLKRVGVHSVQLHHQINGRGANLGAMFRRMGAIEHQHRYTLWIGG